MTQLLMSLQIIPGSSFRFSEKVKSCLCASEAVRALTFSSRVTSIRRVRVWMSRPRHSSKCSSQLLCIASTLSVGMQPQRCIVLQRVLARSFCTRPSCITSRGRALCDVCPVEATYVLCACAPHAPCLLPPPRYPRLPAFALLLLFPPRLDVSAQCSPLLPQSVPLCLLMCELRFPSLSRLLPALSSVLLLCSPPRCVAPTLIERSHRSTAAANARSTVSRCRKGAHASRDCATLFFGPRVKLPLLPPVAKASCESKGLCGTGSACA
jgi:hypothetical protein